MLTGRKTRPTRPTMPVTRNQRNQRLRELLQARSRYLRGLPGTGTMRPPITSRNVRRALKQLAELAADNRHPERTPNHAPGQLPITSPTLVP